MLTVIMMMVVVNVDDDSNIGALRNHLKDDDALALFIVMVVVNTNMGLLMMNTRPKVGK